MAASNFVASSPRMFLHIWLWQAEAEMCCLLLIWHADPVEPSATAWLKRFARAWLERIAKTSPTCCFVCSSVLSHKLDLGPVMTASDD